MAPSVEEPVAQTTEHIQQKLASLSTSEKPQTQETEAPAVQAPSQSTSQHKEPLKLSGILDQFESFDVTPVIGREFVGVNLAKWLRAPNSDELLRDLAITSKLAFLEANRIFERVLTFPVQFLNVELSSSASKTR